MLASRGSGCASAGLAAQRCRLLQPILARPPTWGARGRRRCGVPWPHGTLQLLQLQVPRSVPDPGPSLQTFQTAFGILDKDFDGRLNASEAYRLVAYYHAAARLPPPAAGPSITWDQHLAAALQQARRLDGPYNCLERYVAAKLAGGLQRAPPRLSDLVWSALGAAAAMAALGAAAAHAHAWPLVGHWHQQGLPLLLGSFGTLTVLLFGRPEAEAVRAWPLVAGQLGSTAIAVAALQLLGAGLAARAAAMAATVAFMMWADCVHPPGGALVLLAMDCQAVASLQWHFLLWPSLALTCGVLLPLSALCCWLKRHAAFDWPDAAASREEACSLQQAPGPRRTLARLYQGGPAQAPPPRYRWQYRWRQQPPGSSRRWRDPPEIPPIKFVPESS